MCRVAQGESAFGGETLDTAGGPLLLMNTHHTDGQIVAAARAEVGGRLRSVARVTPAGADVLYVRGELAEPAHSRAAALDLVGSGRATNAGLGTHRYTLQVHDGGLAVGVPGRSGAVVLTLDGTDTDGFEPAVRAVSGGSLVPL